MGMFDGIEDTKPSASGGAFVVPGHYLTRIDRVKAGESQQGNGGFVAIEMTVIETLPDGEVPVDENFNKLSAEHWHRPGEPISHLLMQKHQSFLGNYKAFVANVGGLAEKEVTRQRGQQVTEGLFEGLFVEIRARTTKTRAGNPFTVVGYSREVPPQEIKDRVSEETLERVLGAGAIDGLIAAYSAA